MSQDVIHRKEKILYVKGRKFTAGIIFVKMPNKNWEVHSMAPILWKLLAFTPVKEIGNVLTKAGCTYEWLDGL